MYRKLLMGANLSALPLKQITLGGEIVDQNILNALKHEFPEARIIHVYASTEAGVGFAVTDGLAGFPESYVDNEIAGVNVKVSSDGILMLRNNKLHQLKVGNAENTKVSADYILTGDLVAYVVGRYEFKGRENSTINVGGNKVQPEEIEEVIRGLSAVKLVSVSSKKNAITGELIVATVVPSSKDIDTDTLKKMVLKQCRKCLEGFKVPALIRMVEDIETNASGKIKR
jgi:acyl-CoA synthetase (AMP-forming)/AMP-acid ligase II